MHRSVSVEQLERFVEVLGVFRRVTALDFLSDRIRDILYVLVDQLVLIVSILGCGNEEDIYIMQFSFKYKERRYKYIS